jgi:hypothetical protein
MRNEAAIAEEKSRENYHKEADEVHVKTAEYQKTKRNHESLGEFAIPAA